MSSSARAESRSADDARPLRWAGVVLLAAALVGCGGSRDADPGGSAEPMRQISLLIGIGDYRWASEWDDLENLRGPVNDVARMRHSLERWGFGSHPQSQRVLLNEQATKAGIEAAFRWIAEQVRDSSDAVVIYYSGHGSWAPDQEIDGLRVLDEPAVIAADSIDEALVPWDARDPHDPRQLVLDDEIGAWLAELGTRNVTVIVDACFSGTITRGTPDLASESAPRPRGPRPPPVAVLDGTSGLGEVAGGPGHTLITAASAWQIASERPFQPDRVVSGVLTRHLTDALDAAEPTTRFDELIATVRARVGQNQTPQLEGDRSARLFRVGAGVQVPEQGYATLRSVGAGRMEMEIGAVHGVRRGAIYDVFGPGEIAFRPSQAIGQIRVDSVLDLRAFASILDPGDRLPDGSRAIPARVPPGAVAVDRLTLYLDEAAVEVRPLLETLGDWIAVADDPEDALAEVRRRGDLYQVLIDGHEVAPLLSELSRGAAQAVGSMRGYTGTAAALCGPLRRALSIAAFDAVEGAAGRSDITVELRVLPAGATAPQRSATAVDTAYVGERYDIWAWVEAPEPGSGIFLTSAVSGYTASPAVLWPRGAGPNSPLTGEQIGRPLRLFGDVTMTEVTGIEDLVVVVDRSPYDFRTLLDGLPDCGASRSAADPWRGEEWRDEPVELSTWATASRRVLVLP